MPLIVSLCNTQGDGAERVAPVRLDAGEILIGRGAGAHVLLTSPSVSRRHCAISGEGQVWRLLDTSSGGTSVNGLRLAGPHFLRDGDRIGVGDVVLLVRLEAACTASLPLAPGAAAADGLPGGGGLESLLRGVGLTPAAVRGHDTQALVSAGAALKAALAALADLDRDRAAARRDLGLGDTGPHAPTPRLEDLLTLSPTEAAARIAALGARIDMHQRAVLAAMQESFHHALDQFAPQAIKTAARSDAEAWQAYERAFEAREDGFVETFAQAFARHYAALTEGA